MNLKTFACAAPAEHLILGSFGLLPGLCDGGVPESHRAPAQERSRGPRESDAAWKQLFYGNDGETERLLPRRRGHGLRKGRRRRRRALGGHVLRHDDRRPPQQGTIRPDLEMGRDLHVPEVGIELCRLHLARSRGQQAERQLHGRRGVVRDRASSPRPVGETGGAPIIERRGGPGHPRYDAAQKRGGVLPATSMFDAETKQVVFQYRDGAGVPDGRSLPISCPTSTSYGPVGRQGPSLLEGKHSRTASRGLACDFGAPTDLGHSGHDAFRICAFPRTSPRLSLVQGRSMGGQQTTG